MRRNRKEIAQETLHIQQRGFYEYDGKRVEFAAAQRHSEDASCLIATLPAVNDGQVLLKGEDSREAERVMKDRMRLALAIFARQEDRRLILGAYGCGVFRNDPVKVAGWWRELLDDEGFGSFFSEIRFAVLDTSKNGECIRAFEHVFGGIR